MVAFPPLIIVTALLERDTLSWRARRQDPVEGPVDDRPPARSGERDRVAGAHRAGLNDRGVEAAQAPPRRRRIARLDRRIEHRGLNARAVHIQGRAGGAHPRQLDLGAAGAETLSEAQRPAIEAARREIL